MRGHQGLGGRGEWGMTTHNGYRVSFWGDENIMLGEISYIQKDKIV